MKKFMLAGIVAMLAVTPMVGAWDDDYDDYDDDDRHYITTSSSYTFGVDRDEQVIFNWAKSKNLTTKNSVREFYPDSWVTRDEVAVVIQRAFDNNIFAAKAKSNNVSAYNDARQISKEFSAAINSLQSMGIMKGDSHGNFRPKGFITEIEAVILLSRAAGASNNLTAAQYAEYARNSFGIAIERDDWNDIIDREDFFELIQWVATRLGK